MGPLLAALLNLIFPPREQCPLCGRRFPGGALCPECAGWLRARQKEPHCCRCGRPTAGDPVCADCIGRSCPFTMVRSVGPYSGPLREAVQRFKYRGRQQLAQPLGKLMVEKISAEPVYRQVDVVVPVPMAEAKLRRRGFNQAHLLAQVVAAGLNKPLCTGLKKRGDTVPQINLNRRQREENLRGAFYLAHNVNIYQKTVLIIDDVITSGSTISAAADVLRQGGAGAVLALTLAATPKAGGR
ncbi:ComF family protein [Desulfohalotomaculum tongense]|uniref:double zinc ribbon domain-containing protein n=1 Tax=Desulforadius tongensis TaxID=1216062 RepID=UPI00195742EC|nr:ComF family protein [Desulforadius tongensis]